MKQLDQFNVPDEVLAASGVPLVDLIGEHGAGGVDGMLGPPPADGWRVIDGDLAPPEDHAPTLAAPWINRNPGKWILISVYRQGGRWGTVVRGSGSVVRPGRESRRAGLALDWLVSPMVAPAGTMPTLKLVLRNAGSAPWHGDGEDNDYVRVWALDPAGERMLTRRFGGWGRGGTPIQLLPSLDPGAAMELTATWHPQSAENLPVGAYALEAELWSLELPCSPGLLHLR